MGASCSFYEKKILLKNLPSQLPSLSFDIIKTQCSNNICKIFSAKEEIGAGFLCKIPFPDLLHLLPVLITNSKILEKDDIFNGKKINFYLKSHKEKISILIDDNRKIYKGEKFDITIIEVKEDDGLDIQYFFELDNLNSFNKENINEILENKNIYIIHYSKEENLEASFGKIKRIDKNNNYIFHSCDIEIDSSGYPIINFENFKMIGIHKEINNELNQNVGHFIRESIIDFYNYVKEKDEDEINIIYKIGDQDRIKIFGETFVKNNRNICKIIYNSKEEEIKEYMQKPLENDLLKIKLKGLKKLLSFERMFENCTLLLNLPDISNLNTIKIVNISYLFSQCHSLKSLPDISKWDTSNVVDMKGLFSGCISLSSLPDISKWNINNVENISGIFDSCTSLTSIPDISKWNTNKIKEMTCVYNRCYSLKYLPDISKWNTNNVESMKSMFGGGYSLLSFPDISKWNISKVTTINRLFVNCKKLSFLPDISKWDIKNVNDISYLFSGCHSLRSLPDISKWDTKNVVSVSYLFNTCYSLKSLPNISNWDTSKVKDMSYLFCWCNSLTYLPDISKWNARNVNDMSYLFSSCKSLTYLPDISKWKTYRVRNMENMFFGCCSLLAIPDISNWNVNNVNNMNCMFSWCSSLTSLPNVSYWNLNHIPHDLMFVGCNNIYIKFLQDLIDFAFSNPIFNE